MKAVLRGNFIPLSAYINKWERSLTSNLTSAIKATEQKLGITLKNNRRQK